MWVDVKDGSIKHWNSVVIDGNKIITFSDDIVSAIKIIDGNNQFLIPGLVNAHVHSSVVTAGTQARSDEEYREFMETVIPNRMKGFLQSGFTTLVDPGGYMPYVTQIRESSVNGDLIAPRIVTVGRVLTIPNGHFASFLCRDNDWCYQHLIAYIDVDDANETRKIVQNLVSEGVNGIKVVYDSSFRQGRGTFENTPLSTLKVIVEEAHRLGVPVYAHTTLNEEFVEAISAGVDGFFHAPIPENGRYGESSIDLSELSIEKNIPFVTALFFLDPELVIEDIRQNYIEEMTSSVVPTIRKHIDNGGVYVYGSDYFAHEGQDRISSEIRALRLLDFSNLEVLQSMTINAVKLAMVPRGIGEIKAGKLADMLILPLNPLNDIFVVLEPKVVIKDGRVVVDNME